MKTKQDVMQKLIERMVVLDPQSPDYAHLVEDYTKLAASSDADKLWNKPHVVSGVVTLLGIVAIIAFEERHIITTRAFSALRWR